jgi:hypothetical protein
MHLRDGNQRGSPALIAVIRGSGGIADQILGSLVVLRSCHRSILLGWAQHSTGRGCVLKIEGQQNADAI